MSENLLVHNPLTGTSLAVRAQPPWYCTFYNPDTSKGEPNQGLKYSSSFPGTALEWGWWQTGQGYTCKWVLLTWQLISEIYLYMIFDVSLKKSAFCVEFSRDTFRLGYKYTESKTASYNTQTAQIIPWLHCGPRCLLWNNFLIYHIFSLKSLLPDFKLPIALSNLTFCLKQK